MCFYKKCDANFKMTSHWNIVISKSYENITPFVTVLKKFNRAIRSVTKYSSSQIKSLHLLDDQYSKMTLLIMLFPSATLNVYKV